MPPITEEQEQYLSLLQFQDQDIAVSMLSIDPSTFFEWRNHENFIIAERAVVDGIRKQVFLEIAKEVNNLLHSYKTLQEHMTLMERLKFLEQLSKSLKEMAPPPEFEQSQLRWIDRRDAEMWREQNGEIDEEEYDDDEEDSEYQYQKTLKSHQTRQEHKEDEQDTDPDVDPEEDTGSDAHTNYSVGPPPIDEQEDRNCYIWTITHPDPDDNWGETKITQLRI